MQEPAHDTGKIKLRVHARRSRPPLKPWRLSSWRDGRSNQYCPTIPPQPPPGEDVVKKAEPAPLHGVGRPVLTVWQFQFSPYSLNRITDEVGADPTWTVIFASWAPPSEGAEAGNDMPWLSTSAPSRTPGGCGGGGKARPLWAARSRKPTIRSGGERIARPVRHHPGLRVSGSKAPFRR